MLLGEAGFLAREKLVASLAVLGRVPAALAATALFLRPVLTKVLIRGALIGLTFLITFLGIVFTDLLMGIGIGLAVGFFMIFT